jgi:hypothetical protein
VLADNLKMIDQRLFMRLAEMSDAQDDDFEKLRIRQLATTVANSLESIVKETDKLMDEDAALVQEMLCTLADEHGEFELPVPEERLLALRATIRKCGTSLDEGFVATIKAYMKRSSDDGLEGMVQVLRVLLQTFAAERLRLLAVGQVGADVALETRFEAALDNAPELWDSVLRSPDVSPDDLVNLLQDKMGEVVLGMPAGSAVQGVLAEYLSELVGAARTIAAEEV